MQDLVRMFEEVNNMGGLNLLLGPLSNSVKGLVSVVTQPSWSLRCLSHRSSAAKGSWYGCFPLRWCRC